jgi:V/A-type H+-transporting ATPase subunit I
MLKAHATRWFEIITTRQDFAAVMQELANTNAAQLEARPLEDTQPVLPKLAAFNDNFSALAKTYRPYWPDAKHAVLSEMKDPAAVLDSALDTLTRWAALADPLIARLQQTNSHRADLLLIRQLIAATGTGHPFALLPRIDGGKLSRAVYYLKGAKAFENQNPDILCATIPVDTGVFLIALASPDHMAGFDAEMTAAKAALVPIPAFLDDEDPGQHTDQVAAALTEADQDILAVRAKLEALADKFGLPQLLAHIEVLTWLFENIDDVQATSRTIRITGWTSSADGADLRSVLDKAGLNYVLSVSELADEANAPMFLRNPFWLQPFEFFPRMLGIPARAEADPSVVTALVAPIMFGFMFGDVGQGAVLVVAGLWLQRRIPLLGLLVPGGLAAMAFGVLFGSVFSREDIIAPLWLHPLDQPTTVLATALVMGVLFLLLGVALDLLQSVWRGATFDWLRAHGGLVLTYTCLLLAYWQPLLLWGLPLGVALTFIGARDPQGARTPMAVAAALGEYLETLMRLFVSSVSFSRVGAFALAHAGLSAAIIGIADASGSVGYWIVLLFGNILIIALEGLVTGIQTTRLILFEFFTRFFHAGGRAFQPLQIPQTGGLQRKGNSL